MQYYLAIDIGASSGRHIIGWTQDGRLKTEEIYRFKNSPITNIVNGRKCLQWQHEQLFSEIINGLKRAKEIGKIPYSVGIDTWGVDYALLDKDDKPIEGIFCYRDSRTEKTIAKVHEKIPFPELYAKNGIQFATFNTIYQLSDDLIKGRMEKAESMLMLPSYFHFRLTGVKMLEYTHATTTSMINVNTHTWDHEILDRLGYKKALFKGISQPKTLLGEFTEEISKVVGYKALVVLPATHDTASAVIAAPLDSNTPYISSGTWSLLGVEQDKARTDELSREADYSNEGGLDGTFRFQKNIMGLWMIQRVRKELNDKYDFEGLTNLARLSPVDYEIDVNDLRFLSPDCMTEEIFSAVGKKLSVGETAYVIYNNLARYYARSLNDLERVMGKQYKTLNIIGGGSQNSLLNELTKQKTGRKVIAGPAECTAIGNLLVQMMSAGECLSVKEGRKLIKKSFDIKEV